MAMTGGNSVLVHQGAPSGWPGPISLYVYWKEASQSTESNSTTLSLGMYVTTPAGWDIGIWTDHFGSYVGSETSGTNCKTFDGTIPNFAGTRWIAENQNITVGHDPDGSKTVTIYWKWGVYSTWGGFVEPSGSFSVELTDIARTSIPTLSSNPTEMGSTLAIYTNSKNKAFTHHLQYMWDSGWEEIASGVGDYYPWPIPYSLASKIPSLPSGMGYILCTTYNGSNYIGEYKIPFTATVPNNTITQPKVAMTTELVSSLPAVFSGLYIQGKTSVKVAFEASSEYSTIAGYSASVSGASATGNPATVALPYSGTVTVTGTVTDARGYLTKTEDSIDVIPYAKPTLESKEGCSIIECKRCDVNGEDNASGTSVVIRAKRSYYKVVSDGVQKNFCKIQYQYMPKGGSWSGWETIPEEAIISDAVEYVVPDKEFLGNSSYFFLVRVIDDIGESDTSDIIEVPTEGVAFHLKKGGNGAAFGQYADEDGVVKIRADWKLKIGDTSLSEDTLKQLLELLKEE